MFAHGIEDYTSSSSDDLEDEMSCIAGGNEAAGTSSCTNLTKVADIVEVKSAETVHIGHNINITERIELRCENGQLASVLQQERSFDQFFSMVRRGQWLAQPSGPVENLKVPVKYVLICHTVTKEGFTQSENVLTIRTMQCFHIETCGWPDIAYNFCIGSDGNVYEGRGWFKMSESSLPYNSQALAIAFVGRFQNLLPPKTALKRCQEVIEHGVKIGVICPDYEIIAHCQCVAGSTILDEVKTWKNFSPNVVAHDYPCNLLPKDEILRG